MDQFAGEKYVSVRTFRKSGEAVATPVWPVVVDGKLYFGTPAGTHKVTRLRRNPRVQVAASDSRGRVSGPWVDGTAVLLDGAAFAPFKRKLDAKYRFAAPLVGLIAKLRRWDYLGVEITPT